MGRRNWAASAGSCIKVWPRNTAGPRSVPAHNREVRFLLARGWTLEQVERGSRADDKASEAAMEDRKKQGYF